MIIKVLLLDLLEQVLRNKSKFLKGCVSFTLEANFASVHFYENEADRQDFGQFLENCLNAKSEDQIINEIITLDNTSQLSVSKWYV